MHMGKSYLSDMCGCQPSWYMKKKINIIWKDPIANHPAWQFYRHGATRDVYGNHCLVINPNSVSPHRVPEDDLITLSIRLIFL